jgi:ABC-2 type transport system ATP-binding protein
MIYTDDLTKYFGDFLAVDGVTLHVGTGEVLALLGPNGAGKTTTVRMLTSVLRPSRGCAKVAGYDVVDQPARVRSSVGILTEHHGLYNRMPAGEYLDFFGQIYGMEVNDRNKRINELMSSFGLKNDIDRRLGEFSKGMRQKLALARALLHSPPVLLLDEPTSAMDPESARLVRDSIKVLRSTERAIVICTHNLVEAEELADRIAIIRRGQIIVNGTPEELKDKLLGSPEFEVRFRTELDNNTPTLPEEVILTGCDENWLRFQTNEPGRSNPKVLHSLIEQGQAIISMHEVPRSLEQVYLHAVSEPGEGEGKNVG